MRGCDGRSRPFLKSTRLKHSGMDRADANVRICSRAWRPADVVVTKSPASARVRGCRRIAQTKINASRARRAVAPATAGWCHADAAAGAPARRTPLGQTPQAPQQTLVLVGDRLRLPGADIEHLFAQRLDAIPPAAA